jgi:hypothetical protein
MHVLLPPGARLSPLESLGVLMSRLLHDLTNPLAVMAGNAQIAELAIGDPALLAQALKSMHQASNAAGELLDGYANYHRELGRDASAVALNEVADRIIATNPQPALWPVTRTGPIEGDVALEPRWLAFAVWTVARESGAATGTVECSRQSAHGARSRPLSFSAPTASARLGVALRGQSARPLFSNPQNTRPHALPLVVVWDLMRWVNGGIEYEILPAGAHRCWLEIPLISH